MKKQCKVPKISPKRFLNNAPEYVIGVYYIPKFFRYKVFLGRPFWKKSMGINVDYLTFPIDFGRANGVCLWGQMSSRQIQGLKIRWLDLPDVVREHVVFRASAEGATF